MRHPPDPAPFISGNDDAKLALLVMLVDPGAGGVLLRGGTGTGKTHLARAVASVHPSLPASAAVVSVPLGTTEDNLVGAPDYAALLAGEGFHERRGILARADGRILFADDIGLLPEPILDTILESSGTGSLTVEREGVSAVVDARFTLLAAWNPASGLLRPQIVDRFALSALMDPLSTPAARRSAAAAGLGGGSSPEAAIGDARAAVVKARAALRSVRMPDWLVPAAALACSRLRLDGHRAETAAVRASLAISALRGSRSVKVEHFESAFVLAACHRTRMGGSVEAPSRAEAADLARECARLAGDQGLSEISGDLDRMVDDLLGRIRTTISSTLLTGSSGDGPAVTPRTFDPVPCGRFPMALQKKGLRDMGRLVGRKSAGKGHHGAPTRAFSTTDPRGRKVRVVRARDASECDPLPSVKAALLDGRRPPLAPLDPSYLRRWERSEKPAVTAMVVVDASMSSQAYLSGLGEVLTAVFERFFDPMSRVGLVSVSGSSAELVFPPTRNRRRVFGKVRSLVPGGHSPLAQALSLAERELAKARIAGGARNCFAVLVSDCYPEPLPPGTPDVYASEPYAATRLAARSLGRARIPVIILDPVNVPMQVMETLPGRRLARYIARATNGVLIPVPAEKVRSRGFSVSELLGAENSRIRKLMDQISSQMEVYRKQRSLSLPGAPVG